MAEFQKIKQELSDNYDFSSELVEAKEFGNGHINHTLLLTFENGEKYVLQRINTSIFTKPVELMENIVNVTEFLKDKIKVLSFSILSLQFCSFSVSTTSTSFK